MGNYLLQQAVDEMARYYASQFAYYFQLTEKVLQYGPNLGMPFTRSMRAGLFEIRVKSSLGTKGRLRSFI